MCGTDYIGGCCIVAALACANIMRDDGMSVVPKSQSIHMKMTKLERYTIFSSIDMNAESEACARSILCIRLLMQKYVVLRIENLTLIIHGIRELALGWVFVSL